jgi:hypothetical protein
MGDDDTIELLLSEVAQAGKPIDGDKVYLKHPWNVPLPPKPEPLPPKPAQRYRLTVCHDSEVRDGSDELVQAVAECHDRNQLLELNAQFERVNYHFVRLELIEPAIA